MSRTMLAYERAFVWWTRASLPFQERFPKCHELRTGHIEKRPEGEEHPMLQCIGRIECAGSLELGLRGTPPTSHELHLRQGDMGEQSHAPGAGGLRDEAPEPAADYQVARRKYCVADGKLRRIVVAVVAHSG